MRSARVDFKSRRLILLIMIAASGASILSTDLYAPTLPHLPAYFGTDAKTVQLTMALNMAAYALSQLLWGPLGDRFGRRAIFIYGMAAFALTVIAAAVSQTIDQLIIARILMGAAASVEAVIVLAVIGDLYEGEESAKVFALYGMVVSLVPAAGPIMGGFIFEWFGWRANFFVLAGVVVAVFAIGLVRLPETLPAAERTALKLGAIISGYAQLLMRGGFVTVAMTLGLAIGAIFAYITEAPFILIDKHGVATRYFGLYQAFIVLAFFIGSLIASRIVDRIGVRRLFAVGVWSGSLSGLLVIVAVSFGETPVTLTAAMSVFAFALGPLFATAPVLAFERVTDHGRGMSAALLSTFEMGGGALGALFVSLTPDGTAWPLAICVSGAAALLLVIGLLALRPKWSGVPTDG
ncbi:MAG: multidrug effflux MFS transporter [Alphaproteobacteria bacterium]|jgi:MFS transporter, DHA1 family, multidrug resistance protein|nr:multidrug effflux MFS transporter [Alphaproteobacteria bacterium]